MDLDFKVSTIPQDLPTYSYISRKVKSSDDSIANTDDEVESEAEIEADLVPRDEDSGTSSATSDPMLHSDSESDASSSSDSEVDYEAPLPRRPVDDAGDEESEMTTAATYLQTKNEIVDANIMIPTSSEVEPCDTLEKVGEIISIIGNIVIVRGLPVGHVKSLSEHALDVESLLVFEDRKVLGYIYETFGPTSQPLYQVKFNQHYPLDTNKVWLSREVFHVPQRSHFVFVDQLKKLRGSDASNIHDEEPADDEIEFSDDEKEAAFRTQRNKRRGYSVSSSRQSTPAPSRTHLDDMVQDTYHGSNPYDAHGPYDDDYYVTGPSRPSPAPYDDPYADVPEVRAPTTEVNGGLGGVPNCRSARGRPKVSRGHILSRGTRGNGVRNRQLLNTSRRGYRNNSIASRRTFQNTDQPFLATSQMTECATGYGQVGDAIAHPFLHPPSNAWHSQEINHIPDYQQPQPFIQPHINPRFASVFGLNLPSGSMVPWASQNAHDHPSLPHHWVDTWTAHGNAGSEGDGDTYRPM